MVLVVLSEKSETATWGELTWRGRDETRRGRLNGREREGRDEGRRGQERLAAGGMERGRPAVGQRGEEARDREADEPLEMGGTEPPRGEGVPRGGEEGEGREGRQQSQGGQARLCLGAGGGRCPPLGGAGDARVGLLIIALANVRLLGKENSR